MSQEATVERVLMMVSDSKMASGQYWYLVPMQWWESQVIGITDTSAAPAPRLGTKIPTSLLVDGKGGLLKANLTIDVDYSVVPELAWKMLVKIFGGCDGPELRRCVISRGAPFLEVYLQCIVVAVVDDGGHLLDKTRDVRRVSAASTALSFFNDECRRLRLDPSRTRAFLLTPQTSGSDECELLDDLASQSMEDVQVGAKQILCFQEKSRYNDKWPPLPSERGFLGFFRRLAKKQAAPVAVSGSNFSMMGLGNLGNTCFLASTLQLLLHCPPLIRFFSKSDWKNHVNKDNKMGTRGSLASAFASLISKSRASKSWVYPKELKSVISKFAPQFSGFQQHDSQEVLAFILDGIHEDLNSVTKKPYRESNEIEGAAQMTDSELAGAHWEIHKERNDSAIVEMFHGQLKSRLQCPEEECGNVSVTFDPFSFLQLSLRKAYNASVKRQFLEVTLMNSTGTRADIPRKYSVSWPDDSSNCTVNDILLSLSDLCHVAPSCICLGRLLDHGVPQVYQRESPVCDIKADHHAFAWVKPHGTQLRRIHVAHAILPRYSKSSRRVAFGLPITVFAPASAPLCGPQVYADVWRAVGCYIKESAWRCQEAGASPAERLSRPQRQELIKEMATRVGDGVPEGFDSDSDCCWAPMYLTGLPDANYYILPRMRPGEYPFTLIIMQGRKCLLCTDQECRGCPLSDTLDNIKVFSQDDNEPIELHAVWSREGYNAYYDDRTGLNVRLDPSVTLNREIIRGQNREATVLTLGDCLTGFSANEKLDKHNMWYCNACKEHKEAYKQMQIYSLPDVMLIHFKRFSQRGRYRTKLTTGVSFPLKELDMSPYVISDSKSGWIYDLYAVSNHTGNLGGGHYTAYGAVGDDPDSMRWFYFNDERVTESKATSVCSTSAYVCLYVKRAK